PLNVTVRVNLTNTGEVAGNYTVVLYINGIARTNQTVAVAPGSTVAVAFRVAFSSGTHTVRVDNLSPVTLRVLTPLRVVHVDPRNGATSVSRTRTIVITFNQNIVAGTAYRSITVRTSSGRLKYIRKRISGNRLIITPVGSWSRRTRYIITVPGSSLKTGTGIALVSQFRSSFRTR
ncbi:Ig-like domain-containing protein, partial [Methanothermobacter sp. K4]|uniref:Ig-like domain-containing protein n=1 Tax=Methanothermobacter sp. K4 TaxID=2913262 RepID=UPI001ED9D5F6